MEQLIRGGIYLARLDPAKEAEIGKLRPVAVLSANAILAVEIPLLSICPLSSQSDPRFEPLHVALPPRGGVKVDSNALVEYCRAVSRSRISEALIAQLRDTELATILHRLQRLVKLGVELDESAQRLEVGIALRGERVGIPVKAEWFRVNLPGGCARGRPH